MSVCASQYISLGSGSGVGDIEGVHFDLVLAVAELNIGEHGLVLVDVEAASSQFGLSLRGAFVLLVRELLFSRDKPAGGRHGRGDEESGEGCPERHCAPDVRGRSS